MKTKDKIRGKTNVKAGAKRKIKIEKGRSNDKPKSKPKIQKILSDETSSAMYKVKKENIKSSATPKAKRQVPARIGASADIVRRIHLEYLNIMQRYYAKQYENLLQKFYAKFGQRGEKAKTPQQKSTIEHFQTERNKLFQGGQYNNVHALIERVNIGDGRGLDELYALTDKHQQGMKQTLKNLESML